MSKEVNKQDYLRLVQSLNQAQRKRLATYLSKARNTEDALAGKLSAYVTTSFGQSIDIEALKQTASSKLPAHFVPQEFAVVDEIPLTLQGKIDRKNILHFDWQFSDDALPNTESSEDRFAPPSNDIEHMLAQIWQDVLGMGDVSVNDNFVEVGGDSLLSIRILARINKAGYRIAPEDFFEFPTIRQQALCLQDAADKTQIDIDGEGEFDLIPIQSWFYDNIKTHSHHWDLNCVLSVPKSLSYASLQSAMLALVKRHHVLRSQFVDIDGSTKQRIESLADYNLQLDFIEIAQTSNDAVLEEIENTINALHGSFTLSTGRLFRALFVKTASESSHVLVLVGHHLILDMASWPILIDDLQHYWQNAEQQIKASPLPDSTPFKYWSQKLYEFALSEQLSYECAYWQQQVTPLQSSVPLDLNAPIGANIYSTQQTFTAELTSQEMLSQFCQHTQTDVQTVLLTALSKVMSEYCKTDKIRIAIEGHGRETLFDELDLSHTVGWFTSVFPVLFTCETDDLIEHFNNTYSVIQSIPKNGIGYGLLREIKGEPTLNRHPSSEIAFNYMGKTKVNPTQQTNQLLPIANNVGQARSGEGERAFLIDINAAILDDTLTVHWSYSNLLHHRETISLLAQRHLACIEELIALKIEPIDNTDYDLADLDSDEMSKISDLLSGLDDE